MDYHRVCLGLRQLAAARWSAERSVRPKAHIYHRTDRICGCLRRRGRGRQLRDACCGSCGPGCVRCPSCSAALSLLSVTFTDPGERAKAFGIFGAVAGGGGVVGLLLGGALTEWVDWRWCLFVNLVFAAIALVGAFLLLAPHTTEARPKLDIPGTILVSISLFSIVFGFSKAETEGWDSPATIAWLAAGVVGMVAFVYWQARSNHPLLPLRVLTDRMRAGSFLAVPHFGCRRVRGIPVPDLLLAAGPRVQPNRHWPRLHANDNRACRGGNAVDIGPSAAFRAAPGGHGRTDSVGDRNGSSRTDLSGERLCPQYCAGTPRGWLRSG